MSEDHGGAPAAPLDSLPWPEHSVEPERRPDPEPSSLSAADAWQAALAAAIRRPAAGRPVLTALVALASLAAAVVGGGALALRQTGGDDSATPRPAPRASASASVRASADSLAPLTALLARRSRAVVRHDRAAFLADVDQGNRALVAAQVQLFQNLSVLPLSAWSYTVLPQGEFNRPDLEQRYGAPIRAQAIELRYSLKGFDRGPVARALIYTFVQRGGTWRIGGDSDLDALLPEGGHAEPWDVQPIAVVRGTSSIVIGAKADVRALRSEAALVDRAVAKVAKMWSTGWSRHVVVITASDPRVIGTYFRGDQAAQLGHTAAIHVPTFGTLFGWYGSGFPNEGPTGDRIIVNPKADIAPADVPFVLTHEVTHQATRPLQKGGEPTWLVEGTAEYTAYREFRLRGVDLPPALAADLKDGIDFLPTNTTFYSRDADDHYVEAWLACAYIADHWGEPVLRRFYTRLAANTDETTVSQAEDAAFTKVLHTDRKTFLTGLTAYVRTVAG